MSFRKIINLYGKTSLSYHQIHCEQRRNHLCTYTKDHGSNEHMVTDCKMVEEIPWFEKISKRFSNLLKKYASTSSRFNLGDVAFACWSAAFKHVEGFSLSTFKPIPDKIKGIPHLWENILHASRISKVGKACLPVQIL